MTEHPDGFYWIQTHGTRGWTVAEKNGSSWDLIGSLFSLGDEDIDKHFIVGARIEPPTWRPDNSHLTEAPM